MCKGHGLLYLRLTKKTIKMKSIFFLAALMITTISFAGNGTEEPTATVSTSTPAPNAGIGAAIGAIRSACNVQGDMEYSVSVVSSCFVDGFVRRVSFWQLPDCPPNQPCIQVIYPVGSVLLDCNNNVISVDCGLVSL